VYVLSEVGREAVYIATLAAKLQLQLQLQLQEILILSYLQILWLCAILPLSGLDVPVLEVHGLSHAVKQSKSNLREISCTYG